MILTNCSHYTIKMKRFLLYNMSVLWWKCINKGRINMWVVFLGLSFSILVYVVDIFWP